MKKSFVAVASLMTLTGTAVGLGVNSFASAASNPTPSSSTSTKKHDPDHRHDRRQMLTARLNQAERDGEITRAQAQALKTELKTLHQQAKNDLNKQSTKAERQAEHAKIQGELQSWASTNNFPLSKIMPKLGG